MVYRGRPSPGCTLCRARRLKCDQRRPCCSQCIRAKRVCSGYRDPTALRFYDQSEEVIGKAQLQHGISRESSESSCLYEPVSLIPAPVSVTMDDRATLYTFKSYVGSNRSLGMLPYIPELLGRDPIPALEASIKAIGLATMSNAHKLPDLMLAARREYSTALVATNSALQDPIKCKSDSTLAAVTLLSMYETITCCESDLMGRWKSHVQGAMLLIKMRGFELLHTLTGLELFSQIRMQIALGNIFYKQRMSPMIVKLSTEAYPRSNDRATVFNNFFDILVQVGNLSARIRDISDINAPLDSLAAVIQKALQLDTSLVSWADSISPAFSYTVIENPCVSPEHDRYPYRSVYGENYHVYPNIRSASMWNYYRLMRIVLHEMIRNICPRLPKRVGTSEDKMMAFQSVEITKEMAEGICASVPYHFSLGEAVVGAVFRLLWPLYIVSDCSGSTPRMKRWILQTLDKIGHTTGLQQALTMSQRLSERNGLEWLTRELDKMTNRL